MCQPYQGYPNYPTWSTYLWLTNDEFLYDTALDLVSQCRSLSETEDTIKEWLEELLFERVDSAGPENDLLTWAFGMIHFRVIAKHLRADLKELRPAQPRSAALPSAQRPLGATW